MKTRIIHTKFWEDEKVSSLTRNAKLLFIYLLTNSRINLFGVYELSDRVMCFDTGLNKEELLIGKEELQDAFRVIFYDGWIYLANAEKHSKYTGEKNETAKAKDAKLIPDDVANYYDSIGYPIPYRYGMASSKTYKTKIESNRPISEKEITEDIINEVF